MHLDIIFEAQAREIQFGNAYVILRIKYFCIYKSNTAVTEKRKSISHSEKSLSNNVARNLFVH